MGQALPVFDAVRLCCQSRSCPHTGEQMRILLYGEPVFAIALAKQLHDPFAFGEDRAGQPFVQVVKGLGPCFVQCAESAGEEPVQGGAFGDAAFNRIVEFHVGPSGRKQVVEQRVVMSGRADMVEHGGEEREDVQFLLAEDFQRKGDFQVVQAVCADIFRQDGRLVV